MEIQSCAGPFARRPAGLHTRPESRREAFRGPSSEGICRMSRLLNRVFVETIIPQRPGEIHKVLAPRLSR